MADVKISELTALTSPDGAEELVVNDSGTTKKITITNATSASLPKAGGTMTGVIANFTSTGIDDNATSTAITIDASENVGIGTASPVSPNVAGTFVEIEDAVAASLVINDTGQANPYELIAGGDKFSLRYGDADLAVFKNSGNVGINTASPRALLDLGAGSGDGSLSNTTSQYQVVLAAPTGTGDYGRNIGWVEAGSNIVAAINAVDNGTSSSTGLTFSTGNTSAIAEAMRIDSSGHVLFGCTSVPTGSVHGAGFVADNDGELRLSASGTGSTTRLRFLNPNNEVGSIRTSGSSTAYNTSSDYRLKENVTPMSGATAQTKLLKPCNFDWIAGGNVNGFLAHELAEVVPEAVTGTKDAMMDEEYEVTPATDTEAAVMGTRSVPDIQGIDQSKLVPLLTATIQELIARIEALEA